MMGKVQIFKAPKTTYNTECFKMQQQALETDVNGNKEQNYIFEHAWDTDSG